MTDVKKVTRDIKRITQPSITKGEYEDRVEDLADSVLNDFSDDFPIPDRIWEVVSSSSMVTHYDEMTAPIHHSDNEPDEPEIYAESSGVSGISFGYLQADVREKVREKQNNSKPQGSGGTRVTGSSKKGDKDD